MGNVYTDAIATPKIFVYLTGLTPTTFEEVYRQFQRAAAQRLQSTKARPHIRLIDRNLLFVLTHWLRCYPTYPELCILFGVNRTQICHSSFYI
ncbi:unnamed protein product [Didymodactylos carnosus]|uniref:Transposase Helix-turn-helix domain-containing protein n=1 Tax=Didymodactylos carnosus TaxID=1234261 RepID=A0A814BTA2_9BILA|nr:unnamed protein product [Didymodactylos carnosus]CAF3710188.1 unnamed protein product [Didymodactylos carnosus]